MGFSAAGQHQYQNNVFVDGATNAMQFYGTQSESFPQDWIQEFQVMTNGFSAEFGNASGAVLNVITRSGDQQREGTCLRLLPERASSTARRTPDASPTACRCSSTRRRRINQHRLGGYLGGPIVTNKLFYFGGVESLDNNATTSLSISEYWRNQGIASIIPTSNTRRPFLHQRRLEHQRATIGCSSATTGPFRRTRTAAARAATAATARRTGRSRNAPRSTVRCGARSATGRAR